MSSCIRPATPGFIITLAATVILAVVSFSVPFIKSVYFLKASLSADNLNGEITFGTLGYCMSVDTSTTCSSASVGYQLNVNALVGDTTIQIPQLVIKWLTYVLVLHIVAFGLAAIASFFGLLAHVREVAMTCFSSCISGFAATVALVAFVFDIALFFLAKSRLNSVSAGSASIGNAVWLTLAAWILLFFSGCFYGVGRCCIRRRSRDAWGGKVGTSVGDNGYNEQMRLDAVKAEADRKARQAQPEIGLPAFHEYDQSQPLRARVDGEEVFLEEDVPYRDSQSVSTAGAAGMGTYGRSSRARYAAGGYVQAPPGTRAVDEYNNAPPYSPRSQRRASNITHTTATTTPSMYPPSSNTTAPSSVPIAAMYGATPDNHYVHDPYSPQAYGHNPGNSSRNLLVQQSEVPYDPYGAFSPDTYNATAVMADSPSQSPHRAPYNTSRTPTLDRSYTPGGGAYGTTTALAAPINDPYSDPYYGHPSNATPPPVSRLPFITDAPADGAPTSANPIRGPRGPRNSTVMSPPPASSMQYADNPPTYESGQFGAPGQWGNKP